MIILGIDTATPQVGCAIGGYEGVLASFSASRGQRHAEVLVPAIDFICRQARIELREISVIAVDVGPGLYTGLRVGMATAKSMAQALRVPMIGLLSLDLLAFAVRHSPKLVVAAVDARRGEVFAASYRHVPGGVQRLDEPRVASPAELAAELVARDEEALLVGDGAIRYASVLTQVSGVTVAESTSAYPSAAALVELAHPRAIREEYVQPWDIEPVYLRRPDAEISWQRRESA